MMLKTSSANGVATHSHSRFNGICVLLGILFCIFLSVNYTLPLLLPCTSTDELRALTARRHELQCLDKFYKLYELHRSFGQNLPPKVPPSVEQFEESGMPINHYWFVDHNYLSLLKYRDETKHISKSTLTEYQNLILNNSVNYNPYNDVYLEKMLKKHMTTRQEAAVAGVFGNYEHEYAPWIEALLLLVNSRLQVRVVDHQRKSYENERTHWTHSADFFGHLLSSSKGRHGQFDVVISHLAIEQVGLGRFGEKMAPDADLYTLSALSCVLKPQGLLFLTLSASKQPGPRTKSYVEFNVRRVYGDERVEAFLADWIELDRQIFNFGSDLLLVLRKP